MLSTKARELRIKLSGVLPLLNEKQRRVLVAAEANAYGRGGIQTLARITGMSRQTITRGLEDLQAPGPIDRIRAPGGGRKTLTATEPKLVSVLEALIEPDVRGDPASLLRWTCKSVRNLNAALGKQGYTIGRQSVANLLSARDYHLAGNRKSLDGVKNHPDRNAQFHYINEQAKAFRRRGAPIISADTKKKELIGPYKNAGREWQAKGKRLPVLTHDFPDPKMPKAVPYGVYDLTDNAGWVNVGVSADTAEFSVESLRWWWRRMGKKRYPKAKTLLICVDSGGSNGYRCHLWKRELQRLADQTRLALTVCHFPPGTSKWNKVEHRLFSTITMNWRGRPLTDYRTVVELIAATTTDAGLTVKARLDRRHYLTGITVSTEEMEQLNLHPHAFHGEWNYTIRPR